MILLELLLRQHRDKLCVYDKTSTPLRVLAPLHLAASSSWGDYFAEAFQTALNKFRSQPLTIDTQGAPGLVHCMTHYTTLVCAGDNRPYPMPSASDVFGCASGTFSSESGDNTIHDLVKPRLCAALNRGTLDLGSTV